MSSISSILSVAGSGLAAAQTGLNTVSDNVSNVNTTGYVRKVVTQTSASAAGVGMGVSASQLQLATDRFLQAAGLQASADSSAASARSGILDQAQTLLGDPNSDTSFFNTLDSVFSSFTALSATPTATARATAVASASDFFDQASTIASGLGDLTAQADGQISADVDTVNGLLQKIDGLNADISRASVNGGDATGPEETQSALIDQLSSLMNVSVTQRSQGGVTLRSSDGLLLAGDGAATISYQPGDASGRLYATLPSGVTQAMAPGSGEIGGLIQTRNVDIPDVTQQLSELTSGVADQLNSIHNAYSAVPAPTTLTGRDTGLPLATTISGFTGKTTIGITNPSGDLVQSVAIDFSASPPTMTTGGTTTTFTPSSFLTSLNTALSPAGSASVSGGVLSLSATGANGVVIQDDATTPATNAGQGFSQFFGLNDLVTSSTPADYATGLTGSDANPFAGSGGLTLRLTGSSGQFLRDVTVAMPAAGTDMNTFVSALNSSTTGVGLYGSFNLDSDGQLAFTANASSGASLSVVDDTTASSTSPSIDASSFFGIDPNARAQRAQTYSVRSDISADPNKLALAKANLSVATGAQALSASDASGADALGQAGGASHAFAAAGSVGATTLPISTYAARISASIAGKASDADSAATNATSVATEASSRRSAQEGVNIDQELISLTSYQQAYNASARLIQAAKDLYDTLLQMVD